jgi:hypothetical protein
VKDFPECIFDVLKPHLKKLNGVQDVYERELDQNDMNGAVGLYLDGWDPIDYEIGDVGPSISEYVINIEHLTKFAAREEGNLVHRSVARSIRSMLYRDTAVTVPLRQLVRVGDAHTERLMKWTLAQRFASNNIQGSFYFMSVTTVYFQTSS